MCWLAGTGGASATRLGCKNNDGTGHGPAIIFSRVAAVGRQTVRRLSRAISAALRAGRASGRTQQTWADMGRHGQTWTGRAWHGFRPLQ